MRIVFKSASLNLKLYECGDQSTDWPSVMANLTRDLKKGAGAFVAKDRTPGFVDLSYEKEGIRGGYAAVTVAGVSNWNLETQVYEDMFINQLDNAEWILTPKMLITWGDPNVIRILVNALSVLMGVSVYQKEFENDEMENLLNILTNVKQISGKNPKDCEVRGFNITGVIEDIDGFNFIDNTYSGKVIESVKGAYKFPGNFAADVKLSRKGSVAINARMGMEIELDSILKFLEIIDQRGYEEEEDQDDVEDAEVTSCADLF